MIGRAASGRTRRRTDKQSEVEVGQSRVYKELLDQERAESEIVNYDMLTWHFKDAVMPGGDVALFHARVQRQAEEECAFFAAAFAQWAGLAIVLDFRGSRF